MAGLKRIHDMIYRGNMRIKVIEKIKAGWYLDRAGVDGLRGWCWTDGKKGFAVPFWLMTGLCYALTTCNA